MKTSDLVRKYVMDAELESANTSSKEENQSKAVRPWILETLTGSHSVALRANRAIPIPDWKDTKIATVSGGTLGMGDPFEEAANDVRRARAHDLLDRELDLEEEEPEEEIEDDEEELSESAKMSRQNGVDLSSEQLWAVFDGIGQRFKKPVVNDRRSIAMDAAPAIDYEKAIRDGYTPERFGDRCYFTRPMRYPHPQVV